MMLGFALSVLLFIVRLEWAVDQLSAQAPAQLCGGMFAEPYAFGFAEFMGLETFLMRPAQWLLAETPVRG